MKHQLDLMMMKIQIRKKNVASYEIHLMEIQTFKIFVK